MTRRKGPIYRASDKLERRLRLCGVPSRYLRYGREDIVGLTGFSTEREWAPQGKLLQVRPEKQQETLNLIFEETTLADTSSVVGVGSYPTDHQGLVFGAAVCRRALELDLQPMMINARRSPREAPNLGLRYSPDVAIIHNIKKDCGSLRADACRDWLSLLDDTFLILIVAGTDPVSFFYMRLHYPIDAALYFSGA